MKVSIIILNYNGLLFNEACLKTVFNQTYKDFEVIFVDNGSTDNSGKVIELLFGTRNNFRYISSGKNLGFTGGNNLGYKNSSGEYIVLLNNDTVVEPNWLEELVKALETFENAGLVQSLVLTDGIPKKYYNKNGSINFLGHNIMEIFPVGENGKGEIFLAGGASLIFRKTLLGDKKEIFPDEYFLYSEDTYLSFFSLFSGYKNYHNARSIVYHKGSGTTKKSKSSFITYYQERNRFLNLLIFFPFIFLILLIPYFIFNILSKILLSLFKKKYSLFGIMRAHLWLTFHPGFILKQREVIKPYKKIKYRKVLEYLTCKLFNGENRFEVFINSLSVFYCSLTGLKTVEFRK